MAGLPDHLAAFSIRVRHALRLQGDLQGRAGVLHTQRERVSFALDDAPIALPCLFASLVCLLVCVLAVHVRKQAAGRLKAANNCLPFARLGFPALSLVSSILDEAHGIICDLFVLQNPIKLQGAFNMSPCES